MKTHRQYSLFCAGDETRGACSGCYVTSSRTLLFLRLSSARSNLFKEGRQVVEVAAIFWRSITEIPFARLCSGGLKKKPSTILNLCIPHRKVKIKRIRSAQTQKKLPLALSRSVSNGNGDLFLPHRVLVDGDGGNDRCALGRSVMLADRSSQQQTRGAAGRRSWRYRFFGRGGDDTGNRL